MITINNGFKNQEPENVEQSHPAHIPQRRVSDIRSFQSDTAVKH